MDVLTERRYLKALERLVEALAELSRARTPEAVAAVLEKTEPELRLERDAAGEGRLLQALADAAAAARERARAHAAANEDLAAFAAAASHDLQAPLRHMRGFSQLLLKSGLTGERAEYAQAIERAAEKMSTLVRDLLRFAKEADGPLSNEEVDLSAAAREAISELARAEPDRRVDVTIADGLTARGDPTLLKAVVYNLVRNAWKFSAGRDPARLEFGRDGDEFFVKDDGVGFDPARAAGLFAPFARLHDPRRFPGTGIGLASVRRILARHGGTVRAEGRPGAGATFHFSLPRRRA